MSRERDGLTALVVMAVGLIAAVVIAFVGSVLR